MFGDVLVYSLGENKWWLEIFTLLQPIGNCVQERRHGMYATVFCWDEMTLCSDNSNGHVETQRHLISSGWCYCLVKEARTVCTWAVGMSKPWHEKEISPRARHGLWGYARCKLRFALDTIYLRTGGQLFHLITRKTREICTTWRQRRWPVCIPQGMIISSETERVIINANSKKRIFINIRKPCIPACPEAEDMFTYIYMISDVRDSSRKAKQ